MSLSRSEKPPARAPSTPPEVHDARARVRQLRAEAELVDERTAKAALLYEAGYLHEMFLHQPAQAAQDYLAAYNVDNRSRLPLQALVRMFERRRSYKNLARLYDAEVRAARTPAERSNSLTDQATLALVSGADAEAVRAPLEQALEQDPKTEPVLLYEWTRRAAHDAEGTLRALTQRAESCDDPQQRGALLLELAALWEARGERSRALSALREAALAPEPVAELYAAELARFASEHGFPQELAEANERRATRLAFELTRYERERDVDPALLERLRNRAVAHWYEAARLRCATSSDPLGALRSLESALTLAPDNLLLKQQRMLAYDLLEDREQAAEEARSLLALGVHGVHSAALHFRVAERALVIGDNEQAREKLREAIEAAGGSVAAEAILDDLLLDDGLHEERVAQREQSSGKTAQALEALAEGAEIAAHLLQDDARALALFTRSEALTQGREDLLREAYGCALDRDDAPLARYALDRLLPLPLAPDERAALVHHRYELGDAADRLALVDAELARGDEVPGIPLGALIQAAQARDYGRLAQLHEAFAQNSNDGEELQAERCAAARAWLRAEQPERARTLLEQVLVEAPLHRYALTLLEEVLRIQGDAAGAMELLRTAAAQHESARDTELHLLAAGAAAERAGDVKGAAQSYRDAAATALSEPHGSYGALWALGQLGRRAADVELESSAREGLAAREQARGGAGLETLLLAEHLDLVAQQPAAAQAGLALALQDPDVGHHAAIALALSRTASMELREQALELLATRATDSLRPALLRQLGGELVAHGARPARILDLAERVSLVRPDDRWAIWTRTHTRLTHQEDDAAALEALAGTTTDAHVADAARAEALWARQMTLPEQSIASALESLPPTPEDLGSELGAELAATIVALASPVHDTALRAQALVRMTRDAEPELRPASLLALARAQLAQDDDLAAITSIEELLSLQPGLLAGWELAHFAARKANHPALLAQAAERLAEQLDGELSLTFLEEAADVRIDQLDDLPNAERLLTRALELDPSRAHAYARLHECLTQRGDEAALIALLRKRAELLDEPEALVRLYYELARLERKRGQLDAALLAIDHALMLDDEHVGALALLAEVQTVKGAFREAVAALDRLADARSLPLAQRRLALLGAADFLENRLEDRDAALARLEQLIGINASDAQVHVRIADLCERVARAESNSVAQRASSFERALAALEAAVEHSEGATRLALAVRRADLQQELGRPKDAAQGYERVLGWAPEHLHAARAHFAIAGDRGVLSHVELELRNQARTAPRAPEPLHKLVELAAVESDRELAHLALAALAVLDALSPGEREKFKESEQLAGAARIKPGSVLDEATLRAVLGPPLDAHASQLARAVFSAAAAIDQLEPARFGVGRGQRIGSKDPHGLRDELRTLCATLDLKFGDLYVGGNDPRSLLALPEDGKVSFVAGPRVESPLRGRERHLAGLQVAATYLDTLPLLTRGARDGARLLWAALAAEDCPLPASVARTELTELARSLSKALPRRVRRSLPELARALPDAGAALEAHCRAALTETRKLALLLSGELVEAVTELGGSQQEDALILLRTWMDPALSTSRKMLGLAP